MRSEIFSQRAAAHRWLENTSEPENSVTQDSNFAFSLSPVFDLSNRNLSVTKGGVDLEELRRNCRAERWLAQGENWGLG